MHLVEIILHLPKTIPALSEAIPHIPETIPHLPQTQQDKNYNKSLFAMKEFGTGGFYLLDICCTLIPELSQQVCYLVSWSYDMFLCAFLKIQLAVLSVVVLHELLKSSLLN